MKYVITFYSNFDGKARAVIQEACNMIHALQLCSNAGYNLDCVIAITEVD
jgi:hypothetical protein